MYEGANFNLSTSSPILVLCCVVLFLFLNRCPSGSQVVFHCGSNVHFPNGKYSWANFLCALAIRMSSLETCLFKSSTIFFKADCLCFWSWVVRRVLYVFYTFIRPMVCGYFHVNFTTTLRALKSRMPLLLLSPNLHQTWGSSSVLSVGLIHWCHCSLMLKATSPYRFPFISDSVHCTALSETLTYKQAQVAG